MSEITAEHIKIYKSGQWRDFMVAKNGVHFDFQTAGLAFNNNHYFVGSTAIPENIDTAALRPSGFPSTQYLSELNHSFEATEDGILDVFAYHFLNGFSQDYTLYIYEGIASNGTLLFSQTFTSNAAAGYTYLENMNLSLAKGLYRWRLRNNAGGSITNEFTAQQIEYYEGNEWYNGSLWGYVYDYKMTFKTL